MDEFGELFDQSPPRLGPPRLPTAQSQPALDRFAIHPEFARNPLDPLATLLPCDDLPHQIAP
jgi:hypothetical protein